MYQIAAVCVNSHAVSWLRASTQPTCENPIVTLFHTLGKNFAHAGRAFEAAHGSHFQQAPGHVEESVGTRSQRHRHWCKVL